MAEQYNVFHRLKRIAKDLDQASITIRSSEADSKLKVKNWLLTWILLPVYSLVDLKSLFKGIKSLHISPALPLLTGTVLLPFASYIVNTEWYILLFWGLLICYIISFIIVAPRSMCDFKSGYFRIGAYALFRKQEYEIFKQSLANEDDFYFSSIPEQIQTLIKADENLKAIYTRIDNFLNQEKAELAQKIKVLEEKYAEKEKENIKALQEYDAEVTELLSANDEVHKAMGYVVEFLKATRLAILRKSHSKLNIADISNMIGAGISIYVIEGDQIVLKGEEQTEGNLPDIIKLNDKEFHPFVTAATNVQGESSAEIEQDYFIISKRFHMNDHEDWVISFHVDSGIEKALFLSVGNDILETREVYKMIHSLCRLI